MKRFVLGDPQAPFAHVMALLERSGVLAGDRLRDDIELVSIGDHFDYDLRTPDVSRQEGLRTLRWLASHETVTLILGNHDAARVVELAAISDAQFAAARTLALSIEETKRTDGRAAAKLREANEFHAQFPQLSTSGIVARDYASFSEEQRALVVELLLAGRFHLVLDARLLDGRPILLSHAGLTRRENLTCASLIDQHLIDGIAKCRDDWARGIFTPLSLEPLSQAGARGQEAGGFLAHRPSDPDREGADPAWERDPARPRRFAPWELLPITQVAGHTNHASCLRELARWATPRARATRHTGIRTLRWDGHTATYDLGILPPLAGAADLILVDGELRDPANRAELLESSRGSVLAMRIVRILGTLLILIVVLGGGGLVAWNVFGQGPYGDTCKYSLGCRSFYCVKHELRGERQWSAPKGMCTKSCSRDDECGKDARCVALTDDSKDDLPPFGKPDKACMHVRPLDPDDRH